MCAFLGQKILLHFLYFWLLLLCTDEYVFVFEIDYVSAGQRVDQIKNRGYSDVS